MNSIANFTVGGWQLSGIGRLSSGLPVRLTAPSTISQYGFGTQYPNVTKGSDVSLDNPRAGPLVQHTAAFSAPAPYTVGSSPRRLNELRANNQKNLDISVAKNFRYRERIRAQFHAESFNLTNTPQFAWPDTAFGSRRLEW